MKSDLGIKMREQDLIIKKAQRDIYMYYNHNKNIDIENVTSVLLQAKRTLQIFKTLSKP